MVCFETTMEKKYKKYFLKNHLLGLFIPILIICSPLIIGPILAMINFSETLIIMIGVLLLEIVLYVGVLVSIRYSDYFIIKCDCNHIEVADYNKGVRNDDNVERGEIEKIVKKDDFYIVYRETWRLFFSFSEIVCICSQDQIVEGTIEEFEEMYNDLIEKESEV